jgi:hypothetical protein
MFWHIGLPKTGTTFQQTKVLPLLDRATVSLEDLRSNFGWIWEFNRPLETALNSEPTQLRWLLSNLKNRWVPVGKNYSRAWPQTIVSMEGLVGASFNPLLNFQWSLDMISSIDEDPRVILSLREQGSWLHSIYDQLVWVECRFNRPSTLSDFALGPNSLCPPGALDWSAIVRLLTDSLGRDRVKVLFFEEANVDQSLWINRFVEALDAHLLADPDVRRVDPKRQGRSTTQRRNTLLRRISHPFIWAQRESDLQGILDKHRRATAGSNLRLSKDLGIDLSALGYATETSSCGERAGDLR